VPLAAGGAAGPALSRAPPPGLTRRRRRSLPRASSPDERDTAAGERKDATERRRMASRQLDSETERRNSLAVEREQANVMSLNQQRASVEDRELAARDRSDGSRDRRRAAQDRRLAAREHTQADIDGLTGTLRRERGALALQEAVDHARSTRERLIFAFVDVDGLKQVNDERGHAAGDKLLRDVGAALKTCLRTSDLVVRYGGDEFLCAIPGADAKIARRRFDQVAVNLAARNPEASLSIGLATLGENQDTLDQLTERADAELYALRHRTREHPDPAAPPRAA